MPIHGIGVKAGNYRRDTVYSNGWFNTVYRQLLSSLYHDRQNIRLFHTELQREGISRPLLSLKPQACQEQVTRLPRAGAMSIYQSLGSSLESRCGSARTWCSWLARLGMIQDLQIWHTTTWCTALYENILSEVKRSALRSQYRGPREAGVLPSNVWLESILAAPGPIQMLRY